MNNAALQHPSLRPPPPANLPPPPVEAALAGGTALIATDRLVVDALAVDALSLADQDVLAHLFDAYPFRETQQRALGLPTAENTARLLDGLRVEASVQLVARDRDSGTLVGFVQLVPAPRSSEALGQRIWRLRHALAPLGPHRDDIFDALLAGVVRHLQGDSATTADVLDARIAADDHALSRALQRAGFVVLGTDIAGVVSALVPASERAADVEIGPLADGELPIIQGIARRTHAHHRFGADPGFEPERVGALYADELARQAANPDVVVLVARDEGGRPIGFISAWKNRALSERAAKDLGCLDFIGVDPDAQVRGVGGALNRAALLALRERDVARVTVRTMATNYAALAVLRRIGWKATATSTLLSRWLTALAVFVLAGALQMVDASPAAALEVIVGYPYGDHTIGHTAVRVRTFDADREVIYDFGRYGKTWGRFGFHGEGVMRVWRGERAVQRYLDKQQGFRDSVGYVIRMSEADERRVLKHYEDMLKTAKWRKKYRLHTRYRLAKDYHGVNNQCTSMSLEGMKTHWPRARWEKLLDPRYNQGQGFTVAVKRYFKATQRELGINETVVPLDVIDAFEAARKAGNADIEAVRRYPRR